MKKYFQVCKTKQEAKKLFRELAKKYHPDTQNGDNETMVNIINEYEKVLKTLPSEKTDNTNETSEQTEEEYKQAITAEMEEIINNISHLPIDIEIIGTWIWVSGDTYKYKSYLTAYNFTWCPKKKMYQWHSEKDGKKWHGKVQDIEKIRFNYGTTKVKNNKRDVLN